MEEVISGHNSPTTRLQELRNLQSILSLVQKTHPKNLLVFSHEPELEGATDEEADAVVTRDEPPSLDEQHRLWLAR